ncbi:hypothetical protein DAPPUDRAFT_303400 [Daphnia pulex]|uniref:PH domain-containing protein n=1 Tax=Daphnia pulex TaxID=6669 RepID=E9GG10_DAPPU|nr:hypothetical protein DAPPUDRAFT_303400 [Daphnia pulex]|eukprot:EFX81319.1 hypothetical protein DAPPUDRAFT_303400 [Daphnia pulex]
MHVNGKELITTSFKPATIEGRINYRVLHPGKSKGNFKEFWFKLTGNLLFYFGLNNFGGIKGNEPIGVIVLENCSVAFDEDGSGVFAFVVTFSGDQDRHVFSCFSVNQAQNWVIALRQASYEHLRIQVKILESKLESLGGKSIFKWSTTSSSSSTTPSSVFTQPSNSAVPALPTPPARKRIGPKAKTFVSHMSDENPLPINSFISDNKQPDQDLIKW